MYQSLQTQNAEFVILAKGYDKYGRVKSLSRHLKSNIAEPLEHGMQLIVERLIHQDIDDHVSSVSG